MAQLTATEQFVGTALAIFIVALVLYGIILLIQRLTKGNKRIIESDTVQETVYQPVQTYTSIPRPNTSMTSMGGASSAGAGARVSGGGGSSGAL